LSELHAATYQTMIRTVQEYTELALLPELSEADADRMYAILVQAGNDPLLSFWLDEMDHCIGHRLSLMDEESQKQYKEQQSLLSHLLLEGYLEQHVDNLPAIAFPSEKLAEVTTSLHSEPT